MAAIRHTLQRDIFLPQDERLIDVVHVTKAGKKKKSSFLCASVTTDLPIVVCVHQVKKVDKDNYKKKLSWQLTDLAIVDGKNSKVDVPEFELHFDKNYKWTASSVLEKNNFIACLWKLSQRYLKQQKKPDFQNIKENLLEEYVSPEQIRADHQEEDIHVAEDYQALSAKEEADLKKMMGKCEYNIGNAEAFVERLANDLSVLDGANIHSIIESQQQVETLMHLLDQSLKEITSLEKSLDEYDSKLEGVRVHMEIMEEKDSMIQIQGQNHNKLLSELKEMTVRLDLSHHHQKALQEADLSTPKGYHDCIVASRALQKCMEAELSPGLGKLRAVLDQKELLSNLQDKFAQRLAKFLNSKFIQQGNEMSETINAYAGQMILPKHNMLHRDLVPYAELMQWLKRADKESFLKLTEIYVSSISNLYEKQLKEFFETAKQNFQVKSKAAEGKKHGLIAKEGKGSTGDLTRVGSRGSKLHDYTGSDSDLTGRKKFDMVFTQLLNELEPVCQTEQDFAVRFFGYTEGLDTGDEDVDGGFISRHKKIEKAPANLNLKTIMASLFQTLETELRNFIIFSEKMDSFYSVFMLVRIGNQVMAHPSKATASYLHLVLANCLVEVKRYFDKYIGNMIHSIEESKVSKKSRCGILPFVKEFKIFAEQAEDIYKGTDRRRDLDKAYSRLIVAQFKAIHRIALEHQKTPADVVISENFHHLHGVLARLKINCLEAEKKEAKQKYQDHLQSYVKDSLGRPMEKLNHFFEGVQALVAQGVKEEEVGYQMAFNKQELRKVIKEYPNKEIKKGLESLYKKVEKTLCEEENLMQVVWHSFQDEFIQQYKFIDMMINRCYGGSVGTLEFSIDDILRFFSDIAQSH